jgi:hypothetical protein
VAACHLAVSGPIARSGIGRSGLICGPLVHEVDRLRRIVRDHRIDFGVYDSIAFASDGHPRLRKSPARADALEAYQQLYDDGTVLGTVLNNWRRPGRERQYRSYYLAPRES